MNEYQGSVRSRDHRGGITPGWSGAVGLSASGIGPVIPGCPAGSASGMGGVSGSGADDGASGGSAASGAGAGGSAEAGGGWGVDSRLGGAVGSWLGGAVDPWLGGAGSEVREGGWGRGDSSVVSVSGRGWRGGVVCVGFSRPGDSLGGGAGCGSRPLRSASPECCDCPDPAGGLDGEGDEPLLCGDGELDSVEPECSTDGFECPGWPACGCVGSAASGAGGSGTGGGGGNAGTAVPAVE